MLVLGKCKLNKTLVNGKMDGWPRPIKSKFGLGLMEQAHESKKIDKDEGKKRAETAKIGEGKKKKKKKEEENDEFDMDGSSVTAGNHSGNALCYGKRSVFHPQSCAWPT
ncbi:hypothetical protein VNO77_20781 [Canavalia gladiata]|uniref:Uncharacterized protein n=1 Tax=Canavalia gladiata TaxID=3824 RepID=A0AAN9LU81_CANGL